MNQQKDAYSLLLSAIDAGEFQPGDRLVEAELAERFGVSRTPVREALQRMESQDILMRDGRSLIVAKLDYDQMGELYAVRVELEALAVRLAAKHGDEAEKDILFELIEKDRALVENPAALSQSNKVFHHHIHLASHNRYLLQQLQYVHRAMALMAQTSLAEKGRPEAALDEHLQIATAIAAGNVEAADEAMRKHLLTAYKTRIRAMDTEPNYIE